MNVVLPAPFGAEQAGDPGADLGVEARERDRLAVTLHDPARRDDGVRFGLRQIAHAPNATCARTAAGPGRSSLARFSSAQPVEHSSAVLLARDLTAGVRARRGCPSRARRRSARVGRPSACA